MILLQKMKMLWHPVIDSLCLLLLSGEVFARQTGGAADSAMFVCRELLGRPTGSSIALNLCSGKDAEVFVEYGTQRSIYGIQSSVRGLQGGVPATIVISALSPNTRYYYRVRYRMIGTQDYLERDEHTFQTARFPGSPFVFAIEADPHLDSATSPELYRRTLGNILAGNPDFLIDLGDTFMSDKLPVKNPQEITARHLLLRSFFDTLGHSVPLMLVLGNHEGELGWLLNGTPDNTAVWASTIRKSYYPNPFPDGFYSGDTTQVSFVGLRQNYYAWEWGGALFVVLDPYWYTVRKPGTTKNIWDWTLGRTQYEWFTRVLESSNANMKFVFAHQVVGGNDTEGRGGIEAVPYFEMGGFNSDGTWGFDTNRPGWPKPVHQLMVECHVTAFFHGHDHVFVKQDLDGIVYHELPQPAYFNFNNPAKSYSNTGLAAQYGYTHGVVLPSSGYLRVTVADTVATVDYIRSYLPEHENSQRQNGEVAYSYTVRKWNAATSFDSRESTPDGFGLAQNFPNPFNPVTTIGFRVPGEEYRSAESSTRIPAPGTRRVRLAVYDVLGREVVVLMEGPRRPGNYEVQWDASAFSGGIYFYRLTAGNQVVTKTMLLLK
jgi:hypothetical protein